MNAILVCDCGGTYTRAALNSSSTKTVSTPRVVLNEHHESMLEAVKAAASGLFENKPLAGAAIAVAGQVVEGEVKVVNAQGKQRSCSWPHATAIQFEEWLGGAPVLLINDLEASLKGIFWLHKNAMLAMTNIRGTVALDEGGTVGLVIPGTGFGLAYSCGDASCRHSSNSELAHWTWSRGTHDIPDSFERYAKERTAHSPISVENVVSGPGLSLLFEYFCHRERVEVATIPSVKVLETAKGVIDGVLKETHVYPALKAVKCFARELGRHAAMHAMSVNARGGIVFAGNMVSSIIDLVGHDDIISSFDNCDWGANTHSQTPIAVVENRFLALTGAMSEWKANFHKIS